MSASGGGVITGRRQNLHTLRLTEFRLSKFKPNLCRKCKEEELNDR